ncbi:guanylate-binding protein 1-like [Chanos chanos]|uniref:Guanylate-binding protein 1-like n=1 Tax=Chanos chanos TaxID=29144 RepID=A0A6J2WBM1_CHACN|nr:guanylate-binding protein 1-like [Chanos chanos]
MATVKMPEPICLIGNDENGCMCVMREALDILEQITQPVVVVAIVGLYRTGKSFLMNRLGRKKGFALGATIESKTKGIWMWCLPHPTKEGHTLVLLDTEGLGDVDKGDEKHDTWIFCLAVLLSSTLVYNSMGTIDNDALQKLHYVTELTEHIKVKSGLRDDDDQSTEFMSFFPSFVWAVRDFTLKLELEGRPITADQYLENALKLKPGSSIKSEKYNLPRRCLREFFSPRKCFVFERPASKEKMSKMEQLTDVDLESSFLKEVEEFCSYIFTNAQAKTMRDGLGLIGRMLGTLAETYVEAINSGRVPCLDNAVESLSQIQNKRAVTEALEFYRSEMSRNVQLPTETQEDLSEIHTDIQREAIEIFINGSFNDVSQRYQIDLMRTLQSVYEEYCRDNVETSRTKSKSVISRVFSSLETELRKGSYMRPGGYTDYHNTLKRATEQYRSEKGHGLMREEVLKEYLSEKEGTGQSILAADKSLTESQQEIERERLKSEAREQQQRALEEQNRIKDQQIKDQQRAYDENIKQMLEKFKRQEEIAKQEHERVLNAKLKEQRDLLEQGFKDRAEKMQGEIDNLEEKKKNWSWSSIAGTALDTIGTAAMIFLPGAGKIAGFGLSMLSKLFK